MSLHRTFRRSFLGISLATVALITAGTLPAQATIVPAPISDSAPDAALALAPLGSFDTGIFDASAAEIVQAHGTRLFVVNAQAGSVTVLDYADPTAPTELFAITSTGIANSVAIRDDGLGVIAFEAPVKTDPGHLLFFDANAADAASAVRGQVEVGALPDMVTLSADGAVAVVSNEGEPADDFSIDPEGSVSVVTLPAGLAAPGQDAVRTADFHAFEEGGTVPLPDGVRIFGPTPEADLPVSRNLEPEYVAIDGSTAYVALQEANSFAVVDLDSATITKIVPLGTKDYSAVGLDASDRDERINIRSYAGLRGLYMPDGLALYRAGDASYLVTANEGDGREWGDYSDAVRVKDLESEGLGPVCAALAENTDDALLGRLNVSREDGFNTAEGCYDTLYTFGGRGFSIWTPDGTQVFDSGNDFERVTASVLPEQFNSNHSETNFEGRSDDKGPEPESLTIGTVGDRTYAFIGLERVGGVIVYDITDPAASRYVTYVNNRDFSVSVEDDGVGTLPQAGDLGPEGLAFIDAAASPTGVPLLAVANEVSGTTTLFSITDLTSATTPVVPTPVPEPLPQTPVENPSLPNADGSGAVTDAETVTVPTSVHTTAARTRAQSTLATTGADVLWSLIFVGTALAGLGALTLGLRARRLGDGR